MSEQKYDVRVKDVTPQRLIAMRTLTSRDALGGVLQNSLEAVWRYLNTFEEVTVGPAIVRYLQMKDDMLEVEAGFPVAEEIAGHERITPVNLPGGRAATTIHTGDYAGLPAAHAAVRRWMTEEGIAAAQTAYEIYWVEPNAGEGSEARTEVVVPITNDAVKI